MIEPLKKILVLAPHTDDAELGCGGTITWAIEKRIKVHIAVFAKPDDTLKDELLSSLSTLGVSLECLTLYDYPIRRLSYHRQEVLEDLVVLRRQVQPGLVLLPSIHDLHQDHQVVSTEGLRVFKNMSVWGYELPWNHIDFPAQAFVTLQKHHLDQKWQALSKYHSQFKLGRSYFSWEFIRGLAVVRGVQVQTSFAESFEVFRVRL